MEKNLTNEEKKELKNEAKKILEKQEKKDSLEEKNLENSLNNFFQKIDFLELTPEEKEIAAKNIVNNVTFDKLYFVEIILSILIVVLWLLHNSTAVVIGWMLIAPLLRPINWISFSLARWIWKTFWKSIFLMILSIILSISISYFVTKMIWLWENPEITSRTSPNLIDFFIAIFCWILWVLALKFKRISENLSWVALAVSLLPPLCVVWIELAYQNNSSAFWAFLLFLSNILWVILISIIFFWLFWFSPHDKKLQSNVLKRTMIFVLFLIIILIPLYLSSNEMFIKSKLNSDIWDFLEENLKKDLNIFEVENIKIIENTKDNLKLKAVLKIYKDNNLESILKNIKLEAEKKYNKKIEIDFDIIKLYKI